MHASLVKRPISASGGAAPQPERRVSLRTNISWVALGNMVFGLGNAGVIVVLARLGNPEMVGLFALGLAVVAPVSEFSKLGLRRVIATDARQEYEFRHYLLLRALTSALSVLIVSCIVFVTDFRGTAAVVIMAVSLSKAFDGMSDIVYGLFQHHERMELIALSMSLRTVLAVLAVAVVVYFTQSLSDGILAIAVSWAIVFFVFDYRISRRLVRRNSDKGYFSEEDDGERPKPIGADRPFTLSQRSSRDERGTANKLFHLAFISAPLGLALLLGNLNLNIPRYFIEWSLGVRLLGLFAACAYVVQAGSLLVNALGQAASPRLARYFAAGDERSFRRLLGRLLLLTAFVGAAGLVGSAAVGRQALASLYGPEYGERANVLQWLFAAGLVQYLAMMLGHGIAAVRLFKVQPLILLVSSAATTFACFTLIPKFGLEGAAWAHGAALLVQLILYSFALLFAVRRRRHSAGSGFNLDV